MGTRLPEHSYPLETWLKGSMQDRQAGSWASHLAWPHAIAALSSKGCHADPVMLILLKMSTLA